MKAMKGFTLIECMIAIVIMGIVLAIVAGGASSMNGGGAVSFGINGITEMRCINGFQFVIGEGGQARQVLDEFGKGVRCAK